MIASMNQRCGRRAPLVENIEQTERNSRQAILVVVGLLVAVLRRHSSETLSNVLVKIRLRSH